MMVFSWAVKLMPVENSRKYRVGMKKEVIEVSKEEIIIKYDISDKN